MSTTLPRRQEWRKVKKNWGCSSNVVGIIFPLIGIGFNGLSKIGGIPKVTIPERNKHMYLNKLKYLEFLHVHTLIVFEKRFSYFLTHHLGTFKGRSSTNLGNTPEFSTLMSPSVLFTDCLFDSRFITFTGCVQTAN